jgi:hypothetical protein
MILGLPCHSSYFEAVCSLAEEVVAFGIMLGEHRGGTQPP